MLYMIVSTHSPETCPMVNAKSKEDAQKFAGRDVVWTSPAGKKIHGKISASHGNKGLVRAIFEKGLPGQALTTKVEIK